MDLDWRLRSRVDPLRIAGFMALLVREGSCAIGGEYVNTTNTPPPMRCGRRRYSSEAFGFRMRGWPALFLASLVLVGGCTSARLAKPLRQLDDAVVCEALLDDSVW